MELVMTFNFSFNHLHFSLWFLPSSPHNIHHHKEGHRATNSMILVLANFAKTYQNIPKGSRHQSSHKQAKQTDKQGKDIAMPCSGATAGCDMWWGVSEVKSHVSECSLVQSPHCSRHQSQAVANRWQTSQESKVQWFKMKCILSNHTCQYT